MARIWKYEVKPGPQEIELPEGAQFLTVRRQDSQFGSGVFTWFLIRGPQDDKKEKRLFMVVPTGEEFECTLNDRYLGTIEVNTLMFHLFERPLG